MEGNLVTAIKFSNIHTVNYIPKNDLIKMFILRIKEVKWEDIPCS